MWTIDPKDYRCKCENDLVTETDSKLVRGGPLLLHENIKVTIQSLPRLINIIRARGFDIVNVKELLNLKYSDLKVENAVLSY